MVACECEVHVAVVVPGRAKPETLAAVGQDGDGADLHTIHRVDQRGVQTGSHAADDIPGLSWHSADDHGRTRLDDARLLASDCAKRMAEILLVIEGDGGDRA